MEMKIIAAPIEMVARFKANGEPSPARFEYKGKVIDVEQVLSVNEEQLSGNRMKIFLCQSEINGKMVRYEVKFELQTCKWMLWKA